MYNAPASTARNRFGSTVPLRARKGCPGGYYVAYHTLRAWAVQSFNRTEWRIGWFGN